MRLLHQFLIATGAAVLVPLGALGWAGRAALSELEERAVDSAAASIEVAQRARLARLAAEEALAIDAFLGAFEGEVEHLRDVWIERGFDARPYAPALVYPSSGIPSIPTYGRFDASYGSYADFDRRGPASPWLPRRVIPTLRADPVRAAAVGRELDRAVGLSPYFARVAGRHKDTLDLVWIVMVSGATNVFPPYDYHEVVREDAGVLDLDESQEDYVLLLDPEHNPTRDTLWLEPYLDRFKGVWMTSCVAPLYEGDQFVGTVGADVLLPTISEAVLTVSPGRGGYAFLLAGSGRLVAGPEEAVRALAPDPVYLQAALQTFRPPDQQQWDEAAVASMEDTTLASHADPSVRSAVDHVRSGRSGARELELQGVPSLVTWSPVPRAGWSLALVLSMSEVVGASDATRAAIRSGGTDVGARYGASVLGVILAGGLLGLAVQRRVSRPLERLAEAVSRLSWSGLDLTPVPSGSGHEVGLVEAKFAELVALLRSKREEIRERERELEAANARLRRANRELAAENEERVRAQAALRHEKELLDVTVRSIGEGLLVADAEGRVTMMNAVAERLTGWPEGDAQGLPADEVLVLEPDEASGAAPTPIHHVLSGGFTPTSTGFARVRTREGGSCPIAASCAPIRDESLRTLGVVVVFRDVTEQRRLESELLRIGKLETVQVLAAGIAHDFNNLLAAVLGHLSLVRSRLGPESPDAEGLGQAERAVGRAQSLTRQLLTFAAGGAPIRSRCELSTLLADSASFSLRGASSRLDLDLESGLWPALVDEGQVAQAIHNLVINADQAMGTGGVVRVEARNVELGDDAPGNLPAGRYVEIKVIDRGPGISAANLAHIFDPFFTTKTGGSGLGLAVTHSVVHKHGGFVTCRSKVGRGSTFVLWLPALGPDTAPGFAAAPVVAPHTGGRLLIMDDDPDLREIISMMVRSLGYDCETVESGEAALTAIATARAQGAPYAAALLDLTVPGGMGGVEAAAEIRAQGMDLKLIVSSGYSASGAAADPAAYGFDAAIAKPYTRDKLALALLALIGRPTEPAAG